VDDARLKSHDILPFDNWDLTIPQALHTCFSSISAAALQIQLKQRKGAQDPVA
jgi:hypothetical protein